MYHIRAFGGPIYLLGVLDMVYNLVKTAQKGTLIVDEEDQAPALQSYKPHSKENCFGKIE